MDHAATPTPDNAAFLASAIANLRAIRAEFDSCLTKLEAPHGELSPAEKAFAPEAEARAREDAKRADEAARQKAARAILKDALTMQCWDDILEDERRGELAADLLSTWHERNVDEPIQEPADKVRSLLSGTMAAHGKPEWAAMCQLLGEAVAMNAIGYILNCHGMIDVDECWPDERRGCDE